MPVTVNITLKKAELIEIISLCEWLKNVVDDPHLTYTSFRTRLTDPKGNLLMRSTGQADPRVQFLEGKGKGNSLPTLAMFQKALLFADVVRKKGSVTIEDGANSTILNNVVAAEAAAEAATAAAEAAAKAAADTAAEAATTPTPAAKAAADTAKAAADTAKAAADTAKAAVIAASTAAVALDANDFTPYQHKINVLPTNIDIPALTVLTDNIFSLIPEYKSKGGFDRLRDSTNEHVKKALENCEILIAREMNLRGVSTAAKVVRFLIKVPLVIAFYPFFVAVGGGISILLSGGLAFLKRFPKNKQSIADLKEMMAGYSRSNPLFDLFFAGMLDFSFGGYGSRYLAQANLKATPLALVGTGWWPLLAEIIVKMALFPIKFALEYDPEKGRRRDILITDIQDTLVGILSAPVIFFNHMVAAFLDQWDKFLAKHDATDQKDPGILWWNELALVKGSFAEIKPNQTFYIYTFKTVRFIFDTIPDVFSKAVTNTLRSILPAISFGGTITKAERDNAAQYFRWFLYGAAYIVLGFFLAHGLAAAFAGVGWISAVPSFFSTVTGGFGSMIQGIGTASTWVFNHTAVPILNVLGVGPHPYNIVDIHFVEKALNTIGNFIHLSPAEAGLIVGLGVPTLFSFGVGFSKWWEHRKLEQQKTLSEKLTVDTKMSDVALQHVEKNAVAVRDVNVGPRGKMEHDMQNDTSKNEKSKSNSLTGK